MYAWAYTGMYAWAPTQRVVSTNADIEFILRTVDSRHNGLTFCVGSYGSNACNNVEEMAEAHAARTHFVHLRNVKREGEGNHGNGSFVESHVPTCTYTCMHTGEA